MKGPLTLRSGLAHVSGYAILFAMMLAVCPLTGSETIRMGGLLQAGWRGTWDISAEIFYFQRVPRVVLAACVGGTLAVVGAAFQVILRNPLAEPYTLGITGGASVGAVLAILFPALQFTWSVFSSVQLFALIGAFAVLLMIYSLARRPEGFAVYTLLLAGVTLSIVSAGAVMFLRYAASPNYLVQMDRWMMGGLDVTGYQELAALFPLLIPGLGILFSCMVELNHLALGEELALGHGVDVPAVYQRVFFGGGVATAAAVSLSGPIGFVGLIVPHAVRRLSGYDHRIVLPASFFMGGALLAACDTVARTLFSPTEIPVGIITALAGGPLFLRILLRRSS
ncbi:MAG TPA: iron ABC transporter permease [bacterium]|nr:iron ABC transporter permease [bacterium]HOL93953.1 iron ABC transporter permease [bacterium]